MATTVSLLFGTQTGWSRSTLLSLCLWSWEVVAYLQIPFSPTYHGFDGPWQAVTVSLGDEPAKAQVDLFPGGYYSSFALTKFVCHKGDCVTGGLWLPHEPNNTGRIAIYQPQLDYVASSGLWMTGPVYLQSLDIDVPGGGSFSAPHISMVAADLGNQILPNGKQVELDLGFFALGSDDQQQIFTSLNDTMIAAWLLPGWLYNKSLAESYSFSLHLGSTKFNFAGSMMFGGYDKGQAIGPGTTFADNPPLLQDIVIGVETGGSPFNFTAKAGLLLNNDNQNMPISAEPDSVVPYLHLPKKTCDNLVKYLPVTFDHSSAYYLWDTNYPSYVNITSAAAYLGFVFPPALGDSDPVTIKVPF